MSTYLNLGQEYVLRQANKLYEPDHTEEYHVWAVPQKQCKRTTSQVLLYDWPAKEGGPSLDIDS